MEGTIKHHSSVVYEVHSELKQHVGKENAISADSLSRLFNISERELREVISTIRTSGELRKIVASCNFGYYIPTSEEFTAANRRLERQAFSLLKVAYANKQKEEQDGKEIIQFGTYYKSFFESFGTDETNK